MAEIRPYRPSDLDALYEICLVTGDAGLDASSQHNDGKLVGHVYSAPYGVLEPENTLIVEDDEGVAGYLVGTYDTVAFSERMEREWWPTLRAHYAGITRRSLTKADRSRVALINKPETSPADILAQYPGHIHMNLRSRLRGQGLGGRMVEMWLDKAREAGVAGVHLGASPANASAINFWGKHFDLLRTQGAVWFGKRL